MTGIRFGNLLSKVNSSTLLQIHHLFPDKESALIITQLTVAKLSNSMNLKNFMELISSCGQQLMSTAMNRIISSVC